MVKKDLDAKYQGAETKKKRQIHIETCQVPG